MEETPQTSNNRASSHEERLFQLAEEEVTLKDYPSLKEQMAHTAHPSEVMLHEYALGVLNERDCEYVRNHLLFCELCTDDVIELMRSEQELERHLAEDAGWSSHIERIFRWISEQWTPRWAGELVTAADIPEQKYRFLSREGEINVSCHWKGQHGQQLAYISMSWRAELALPSELWVRFMHPETQTVLSEISLGSRLKGEKMFTTQELGFDPSCKPWAIVVLLSDIGPNTQEFAL